MRSYHVNNCARIVSATNNMTAADTGRRYTIIRSDGARVGDVQYWKEYNEYIRQPCNQRAIYDYLMGVDISDWFGPRDLPETELSSALAAANVDPTVVFLKHKVDDMLARGVETQWEYSREVTEEYCALVGGGGEVGAVGTHRLRTLASVRLKEHVERSGGGIAFSTSKSIQGGSPRAKAFGFALGALRAYLESPPFNLRFDV